MNYWLIAGIVLSVLAAITTGIGTVIQQKQDTTKDIKQTEFQDSAQTDLKNLIEASSYVIESSKRVESTIENANVPEVLLTGVRVDWTKGVYEFQIENVGNATADAVDLLLDYALPAGHGNLIRSEHFIRGEKTVMTHDIFPHYASLKGATYDEYISNFRAGKRPLIVHIFLTCHWGQKNSKKEKYILINSLGGGYLINDTNDIPLTLDNFK